MRISICLIVLGWLVMVPEVTAQQPTPALDALFVEILTNQISPSEGIERAEQLKTRFIAPLEQAEILYFQGMVSRYGIGEDGWQLYFRDAFLLLEQMDRKSTQSERFYLLMGDTLSQLMDSEPLLFKAKWGLKIEDFYLEAINLDQENRWILLSLAVFYYNAPRLAGGSEQKAQEYYSRLESVTKPFTDNDIIFNHMLNVWGILFDFIDTERLYPEGFANNPWTTRFLQQFGLK